MRAAPNSSIEKAVPRHVLATTIDSISWSISQRGLNGSNRLSVPSSSRNARHSRATTVPGMIQAKTMSSSSARRTQLCQLRKIHASVKPSTAWPMIAEPTTYPSVVRSDCQNCSSLERVAVVLQADELGMDRRHPGQRAVGQPEVQRPHRRDDEEDGDDDRRRPDEPERAARAEQVAAGVLAPAATLRSGCGAATMAASAIHRRPRVSAGRSSAADRSWRSLGRATRRCRQAPVVATASVPGPRRRLRRRRRRRRSPRAPLGSWPRRPRATYR